VCNCPWFWSGANGCRTAWPGEWQPWLALLGGEFGSEWRRRDAFFIDGRWWRRLAYLIKICTWQVPRAGLSRSVPSLGRCRSPAVLELLPLLVGRRRACGCVKKREVSWGIAHFFLFPSSLPAWCCCLTICPVHRGSGPRCRAIRRTRMPQTPVPPRRQATTLVRIPIRSRWWAKRARVCSVSRLSPLNFAWLTGSSSFSVSSSSPTSMAWMVRFGIPIRYVASSFQRRDTLMLTFFYLQPYATASYKTHSLLATVNVLRSVIAAAAQVLYLCPDSHSRLPSAKIPSQPRRKLQTSLEDWNWSLSRSCSMSSVYTAPDFAVCNLHKLTRAQERLSRRSRTTWSPLRLVQCCTR